MKESVILSQVISIGLHLDFLAIGIPVGAASEPRSNGLAMLRNATAPDPRYDSGSQTAPAPANDLVHSILLHYRLGDELSNVSSP